MAIMGNLLGEGCYSKVYAHPTNENRVYMVGEYSDDLGKLALYATIGYLYSLEIESGFYTAELERMYDESDQDYTETILDHVRMSNQIDYAYCDNWQRDYTDILWEYATNPNFSDKVTRMCSFLLDSGVTKYHHDNHSGNWLVDKSGDCLPMDVFNLGYYLSNETTSKMQQLVKEKTQ